jgi:predicted ATPase/DNA-binding CsgD family transcriptional regulator
VPERPATHTAAAPVGTTFLAASADDHEGLRAVLDDAAAAHGGVRWADDAAAFPSAAEALAAAITAGRIWRRAYTEPSPCIAVHAEGALRDGSEGGYRGPGVSRCRRLREIAAPGQVLFSATAAGAPPVGATLHDVGVHRLRDLSPPLRVFALLDGDDAVQAPRSLDAYPHNLPSRPTTFVGRDAELAELHARLPSTRLLTIVGPGGSGKTRLAAQLAAEQVGRWDDGVWWVGLEELADPAQVAGAAARALDLLVDPASGAVDSLRAQLATKRLLLCLDNCEHVLDAAAHLAGGLYQDCPDVTIVATAREPLGLTGEAVWRLGPMAAAEGRALFLERAVHAAPDLAVDSDDDAAITSMSSRLDGSPLALELAAAWLRTLTPRQIEAGLDDRFSLLVRSPRDAVPRHASLLASIAWSHDLLDAEDRAVLRRLAVFAGDFDIAAAQAVCGGDGAAVLGAIARLVDKSLVVARVADGDVRYRLPETIREYASDRLRAAGERRDVSDRLLDHLLARAQAAAPDLDSDKDRWRTTIGRDYENLRAAIEHGLDAEDPERGRRLAAELPWLWHLNRRGREGLDILRRAIARAPDEGSALQARLLAGIALVADTAGPLDVEVDAARRAAELAAEHGDDRLLALCLALEAVGRLYTDLDAAREASLEAERIAEAAGERFVIDAGRALRGIVAHLRDEHAEAQALLADAAEQLASHGDRGVASTALAFHSGSALLTGDVATARELAERSIATAAPLADHLRIGMGRSALGLALGACGDVAAGLAVLEPVRPLVADPTRFLPEVNRGLGLLHLWAGEPQEAIRWLTAEASSTDGGEPTYLAIRTLPALAAAQRHAGELEAAWDSASRAVELARARGMPSPLADGLVEQARLCASRDREDASALHHEALRIRTERGLWPGVVESLEELAAMGTSTPEQDVRLLAAAATARTALSLPTDRAAAIESLQAAAAYAGRGRGSRRRPASGWESLTTTEVEVVRLAVDGLTNPEIGARLFMSRGTVKTHLSHVYAKLDVSNRTELAAVAGQLERDGLSAARPRRS